MKKQILFTKHAEEKIVLLGEYGFKVTKGQVKGILKTPQRISAGYKDRKIAEGGVSPRHLLRVVYEESSRELRVITLYPMRKDRYEN